MLNTFGQYPNDTQWNSKGGMADTYRLLGIHHCMPSRLLLNGKFGTKRMGQGLYFLSQVLYNKTIKEGR